MRHVVVALAAFVLLALGALDLFDGGSTPLLVTAAHAGPALTDRPPVGVGKLVTAPVKQDQVIKIPADPAARRKFPHDNPRLVDRLAFVNMLVNAVMTPEDDMTHYGVDDLWVEYPPDAKGDCEDYALTKFGILEHIGWNIVANAKFVQVFIGKKDTHNGHELLAVRLPSGAVAYMDMLNWDLMTRAELVRKGYRFFDWKA